MSIIPHSKKVVKTKNEALHKNRIFIFSFGFSATKSNDSVSCSLLDPTFPFGGFFFSTHAANLI